jgi:hypothetical protein
MAACRRDGNNIRPHSAYGEKAPTEVTAQSNNKKTHYQIALNALKGHQSEPKDSTFEWIKFGAHLRNQKLRKCRVSA